MNILHEIADRTRQRVDEQKRQVCLEEMKARAEALHNAQEECDLSTPDTSSAFAGTSALDKTPPRFEHALRTPGVSFICELKKASPSKGVIDETFDYLAKARAYQAAGAHAISVLTEQDYFKGDIAYLKNVSDEVSIPILRKDFIIDEYMIYEAKVAGADAVLLIVALLDTGILRRFIELTEALGMSALVEAHTSKEIAQALAARARIIGVNNRNLATFEVDITLSERLRPLVPSEVLFVSESGISQPDHITRLHKAGVDGVLIGESLMRSGCIPTSLEYLRSGLTDDTDDKELP